LALALEFRLRREFHIPQEILSLALALKFSSVSKISHTSGDFVADVGVGVGTQILSERGTSRTSGDFVAGVGVGAQILSDRGISRISGDLVSGAGVLEVAVQGACVISLREK
jgi:hypothetical protein